MSDQETLGSRLARENTSLQDTAKKMHTRTRKLEEAIRHHAEGNCDCKDTGVCLIKLYRLIPLRPRLPWYRGS